MTGCIMRFLANISNFKSNFTLISLFPLHAHTRVEYNTQLSANSMINMKKFN